MPASFPSGTLVPALPALDLDESIAFYCKIGFTLDSRYDEQGYAILGTDGGLELHLWLADDPDIPENASIYWRVEDITGVYADLRARGIASPRPPEAMAWGMTEFNVIDPAGCLLRIGAPSR